MSLEHLRLGLRKPTSDKVEAPAAEVLDAAVAFIAAREQSALRRTGG